MGSSAIRQVMMNEIMMQALKKRTYALFRFMLTVRSIVPTRWQGRRCFWWGQGTAIAAASRWLLLLLVVVVERLTIGIRCKGGASYTVWWHCFRLSVSAWQGGKQKRGAGKRPAESMICCQSLAEMEWECCYDICMEWCVWCSESAGCTRSWMQSAVRELV